MHMAIVLFLISSAVLVVVSLLTKAPDEEKIRGLIFGSKETQSQMDDERNHSDPKKRKQDIILSIVVIALVAIIMVWFTG